jgi:hypothetical protein
MADEDRQSNVLISALIVGCAVGLLVGTVLFARLRCAPRTPYEEAQGLLRSCERLLESIEASLAEVRRSPAIPQEPASD